MPPLAPHSHSPSGVRAIASLACLVLVLAGCGHDPVGKVGGTREVSTPPGPGAVPEAIRLGLERPPGPPSAATAAWSVDLPPGWKQIAPRPFRNVNLVIEGAEGVECYFTVTERGTVADNVNRWRDQMGLEPLDAAALDALPREPLAGGEAVFVDLTGDVNAMGTSRADVRVLGLVRVADAGIYTLRMIGPVDAVGGLVEDFLRVAAGLRRGSGRATAPGEQPPLPAGHPPLPGPAANEEAAPGPAATEGGGLAWTVPAGWTGGPSVPFSTVSFQARGTPPVLVTMSQMGEGAGGWEANAARWAGQMGVEPPGEGAYDAAEKIEALGVSGRVVRYDGTLRSRDGRAVPGAALAAIWIPRGDDIVIIKAVGRVADVDVAMDELRAFARSLKAVP